MAYILRPASANDATALTECIIAAYAGYAAQGINLPPVSEGVAEEIRDKTVILADEDGRVLGGVILSVSDDIAYLLNIAVHPDQAGRGIGRALIGAATDAARRAGHRRMKLATHRLMPANVAMYEHLGWTVTRRDNEKVVMEFALA